MRTMVSITTTTATVSTVPDAYEQVAGANAIHLLLLDSRNVSGLLSGYQGNATILWTGGPNSGLNTSSLPALHGYRLSAIGTALRAFTGQFDNFSLSNESQTLQADGAYWLVNSTFSFSGYGGPAGIINGTILAQDSYVHVSNTWLILSETWNFTEYMCNTTPMRVSEWMYDPTVTTLPRTLSGLEGLYPDDDDTDFCA